MSTAVGEPGGILHRLRLAADAEEAEELDHGEGKALMNGSLLLLTFDDFATIRCGVCCRGWRKCGCGVRNPKFMPPILVVRTSHPPYLK